MKKYARYLKLSDSCSSKEEENYPTFWDGFLYFFGLVENPHNRAMEVFRQRNRSSNLKSLTEYSDEEAMQMDQEALRGDWEQVGQYLQSAVKQLQEQHPELKKHISSDQQT